MESYLSLGYRGAADGILLLLLRLFVRLLLLRLDKAEKHAIIFLCTKSGVETDNYTTE